MKTGLHSRTNVLHLSSALAAVVFGLAAAFAPGKVSAELAASIASLLLLLFAGTGGYLKADDRKKLRTAADMLIEQNAKNAKSAAKAAAKVGAGPALALLCGCSSAVTCPTPIRIDAERDTPTGAPTVAIRCNGSVLWRQPCPAPEVTNGRLLCGGADAGVALPLEVTRG